MNIYFFKIETNENETKKVVLDGLQILSDTNLNQQIGRFHYDINTKELVCTDWTFVPAAVPA